MVNQNVYTYSTTRNTKNTVGLRGAILSKTFSSRQRCHAHSNRFLSQMDFEYNFQNIFTFDNSVSRLLYVQILGAPKSSPFAEFCRFEAKICSLIYAVHKLEEFQFIIQFQGYCRDNILSAPKLLPFAEFFVCGWLGESIQILQNINLSTTQPKSFTIS